MFRYVRDGYDRRSLIALVSLAGVYATVGVVFNHLIDTSRGMDWLLAGIWLFMTATLCWGVDIRRDLKLAAIAFLGGLVIEWWGTTTELWKYYTRERPPIWILPAWPVAALTIERLALITDNWLPSWSRWLWWLVLPGFVLWMSHFSWVRIEIVSTKVIIVLMLAVLATSPDRKKDLAIFIAGGLLGIFLEYWGTSRRCWRYYTKEVPPWVATVAHGFASVAFARGVWMANQVWARVGTFRARSVAAGEGADRVRPS